MSYPERGPRRITSIPLRTSLDVLRGRVTLRIGGSSSLGGTRRVSREPVTGEPDWSKIVAFKKPSRREKPRPGSLYERDGKIKWEAEVSEDYNGKRDLGIILQFDGIRLTEESFLRSKHNRPDRPVFYIPLDYNKRIARLFLATRGDIFESQIVTAQMGVNPFFQEELYLPQLSTTHDPTSMTVFQNNNLVIVSYNPCT